MSQIGSFALLLALGLSAYSFLAGFLSLFRKDAASARLGETARRAGIATFAAVVFAAVVLVVAAFSDDFSIAYIFHHSNRELPAAYKFAVLWSGQEGSLLFWSLLLAGYGFVLRLRYCDHRFGASFLFTDLELRRPPVRHHARCASRGWLRPQSSSSISRDGHPSAHALPGICRLYRAICLCSRRAHHEVSRREMDSDHAPLDHGDVVLPNHRSFPRSALGLRCPRMGRLLWMGSRRKCLAHAVAHRHRIPALGDDAGKARNAESLEHAANLRDLPPLNARNLPHSIGRHQFRSRLRAVFDWNLVSRSHRTNTCGFH